VFTGILTGNRAVIVPDTVAPYRVRNATSGSFTLTIKTAAGTGVTVGQNEGKFLVSDGTNVFDQVTPGIGIPLAVSDGGTGATSASGARVNLGGTTVGNAVFTAADAGAARTAIDSPPNARQIATGTGLTGGGNLSADRTLSIAAGGVDTTQLANNAVTTAKIADANVTTAKIADGAVTPAKTGFSSPVSFASGTASAPAVTITGDTDTGMFFPTADTIAWAGGGTELMRLDAGGLALGTTTTANAYLTLRNTDASLRLDPIAGAATIQAVNTGIAYRQLTLDAANVRVLGSGATEFANFQAGGFSLRGFNGALSGNGFFVASTGEVTVSQSAAAAAVFNRNTSDGTLVGIYRGGALVGSISVTTTATAYNTTSDYRLKDQIEDLTGSGGFIDALKPRSFIWKSTGERVAGFIAHEAQEVSPSSVTGEKDGEEMQAMMASSPEIMAHIIAELKSLRARVAELEAGANA